jgi:hypothetical protein
MNQDPDQQTLQLEITEHIFGNAPTMLALCLTMVGLIKIYAALHRITTLTDDFLMLCLGTFLLATIFSYLALRSPRGKRRMVLVRLADATFLSGLSLTAIVASFVVFTLTG